MLSEALLIAIGIAAEAAGAGQARPACNAVTRGLMWPLEANHSGKLAVVYAKQGMLEICTKGPWKYKWIAPVVHVRQLKKESPVKADD